RRHRMRHLWAEFFTEWDVMLTPVGASAAIPHDHEGEMADRTISVNGHRVPSCDQLFWAGISGLFHLPTTAAPLGFTKAGLPVGVQIIGAPYADRTTIAVAGMLERGWQGFTAPPGWE
ncbi:MAG TPA: amidase family protein, partial [Acetobacteraceae bacterium]|nr:amidase family protein [Acetobacteraceae bacterium]